MALLPVHFSLEHSAQLSKPASDGNRSPAEYYPTKEVLIDYKESTERKIEDYLGFMNDSDLLGTDGFSTRAQRKLDLGRIKWV